MSDIFLEGEEEVEDCGTLFNFSLSNAGWRLKSFDEVTEVFKRLQNSYLVWKEAARWDLK